MSRTVKTPVARHVLSLTFRAITATGIGEGDNIGVCIGFRKGNRTWWEFPAGTDNRAIKKKPTGRPKPGNLEGRVFSRTKRGAGGGKRIRGNPHNDRISEMCFYDWFGAGIHTLKYPFFDGAKYPEPPTLKYPNQRFPSGFVVFPCGWVISGGLFRDTKWL